MIGRLCLACALLLAACPASATAPGEAAQGAVVLLRAAADSYAAAASARDRVAALTAAIRAYEAGLGALRDGLRLLARDEQAMTGDFAAERARLSRLLAALQALERTPPELRLLHPSGPVGAVRAGMMMADLVPVLESRGADLAARIDRLRILRALREAALDEMTAAHAALAEARAALGAAITTRRASKGAAPEAAEALAALARDARTMEDFARALDAGGEAGGGAEPAREPLPLPVSGTLLRGYDSPDAAGIRRPGLILAAEPRALVTAPALGTLRYSGPLLDYGNVIILETAPDTLLVLAGLDLLYDLPQGPVPAGTPLGLLPGEGPVPQEFLRQVRESDGASGRETLYIEVRHRGETVDPSLWFATDKQQESQ